MKLFINNKRVKIKDHTDNLKNHSFDVVVDSTSHIELAKLTGQVLLTHVSIEKLLSLLKLLELKPFQELHSLTFLVDNKEEAERKLKAEFKIIKAAGGVVVHEQGKVLMILRLGYWDLPKGKLDEGELTSDGALREVEEECGIQVELVEKLCSTWHSYTHNEKRILKKSTWYVMRPIALEGLRPQTEEGIEAIEWVEIGEALERTSNSYASIEYVLQQYKKWSKK